MTFTTASLAVAGLVAVAIPILIHLLFRTRRKPVQWAAMRFLLEAFKKHRKRMRIEQLILLTLRCLALVLLGTALARPILQAAGLSSLGASRAVFLVIDNSLASSVTLGQDPSALAKSVQQASTIVDALQPGDVVSIITTAQPAQALLTPPSADHPGVVNALNKITQQQTPADFSGAFDLLAQHVHDAAESHPHVLVYLLSEFREGSANLSDSLPPSLKDLGTNVTLLAAPPAQAPADNFQITSVEPLRTLVLPIGQTAATQVAVHLSRTGGDLSPAISRVELSGEGVTRVEPRTVKWQPGQTETSVEFSLTLPQQRQSEIGLTAAIEHDCLDADNRRNTIIDVRPKIRAVLVDRREFGLQRSIDQLTPGQWIHFALEPTDKSPVDIIEVEPAALTGADLRIADMAVLVRPDLLNDVGWSSLKSFVDDGGLLVVLPPTQVNVHQWTDRFTSEFSLGWHFGLETVDHPDGEPLADRQPAGELTRLIASDLPDLVRPVMAFKTLPVDASATQAQTILQFADGSPMLIASTGTASNEQGGTEGSDNTTPSATPAATAPSNDQPSRGIVLYLAVAPELDWTNLPSKPLMVPLFQEIARQGLGLIRQSLRLFVGDQPRLAVRAAVHHIVDASGMRINLDPSSRLVQPIPHE
ncbi:MAG TPA: BatA domain-containing protein, partial [Phycisphaerales bacterium]|nr:BatA domain-containing protein [Phycisphaerales bacterium]